MAFMPNLSLGLILCRHFKFICNINTRVLFIQVPPLINMRHFYSIEWARGHMSYAKWLAIDELDTHNKGCLVLPVPFWDNILEISLSPCSVFT